MNLLSKIISNQTRAEIFRLLFIQNRPRFYLREFTRHSGLTIRAFQKELLNLKELDLIKSSKDGNRVLFEANSDHPLYGVICQLVSKTSGIPDEIRDVLKSIGGIEISFIFGSYAAGEEKGQSDIDLIVIGDVSLRSLTPSLKKITEISQREVNPHVYSMKAWRDKIKKEDHFIKSVLNAPKMMLIGEDNELK